MHELKAEYKENDCVVKIASPEDSYLKEPYMILNLEKYFDANGLNGLSRCDFVCVFFKDGRCEILFVELKDLEEVKKGDLEEVLDDIVNNKFPQTLQIMDNLTEFLNIRCAKCYGVLVLPPIDQIWALMARFRSKFVILKKKSFDDVWIVPCGGSIRERMF